MWMYKSDLNYIIRILFFLGLVCSFVPATFGSTGCGGYLTISAGITRSFGVPPGYPAYSHCIWIIVAEPDLHARLSILSFSGQTYGGDCVDTLTVRDGDIDQADLLETTCGTVSNTVVTSSGRWLWVQFKSDGSDSTSSVSLSLTTVTAGHSMENLTNPLAACKSFEFQCSNLVCLPRSYICDGFNDCGCMENCDESDCIGLGFAPLTQLGFSAGIGVGMFIFIFIFVWLWEKRRRRMAKQKEREDRMKEEGRGRPSKNKKDDKKDKKAKVAWHK
ncbi:membrane frizzled-related protein-like [Mizuhopecten yessoensis]|uniref:membrane frizzled-related protein-like n=1 Tax=Mizuhopecten yessoensis TaxID=6573 RepID=UPI000B4579CF|nr:membrane frizzled-related protein-like [Mizuhopecten yessoensis]